MSMTDPVADFLTRLRNAARAQQQDVTIPSARLKQGLARILNEQGYIEGYEVNPSADHPGEGHVSVVYTDIMDLGQLTQSFRNTYSHSLATVDPGATGLSDTWMVATYNGMEAAYTAIQQAYGGGSSIPTRDMVRSFIDRLNTGLLVPGATGNFSLSQYGRLITSTIPIFADINDQRVPFSPAVAKELGLG